VPTASSGLGSPGTSPPDGWDGYSTTGIKVTLLSDSDGMLYSPLLPDVAVGALEPRAIKR